MNIISIRSLKVNYLSLFLAVYIGLLFNLTIFVQRYKNSHLGGFSAIVDICLIIITTFWLLTLFSYFKPLFYKTFASIVVIISAITSYYTQFFNVTIGYSIVSAVFTDVKLNSEIFNRYTLLWVFAVSSLPLLLIWCNRARPVTQSWLKKISYFLLPVVFVWGVLAVLSKRQKIVEREKTIDLPSYGGTWAHSYLPVNWISALGFVAYTTVYNELHENQLINPAEIFTYQAPENIDDLYVVFIIGETARWDHMSVLDYYRDTTPWLRKEKNLIAFKGISCDTATRLSLRCMFVREEGSMDNVQHTLLEHNIFAVLKTLGFSSELFSMQSEVSFYKNTMADSYKIREMIAAEYPQKPIDDIYLVDQVKQSLKTRKQGKHLIILHTKGSHYLYTQRYPRKFARYQPECMGPDRNCSEESIINSYDNSILYTDYVLKNIFDQFRSKKAIIFYASDHGESIENGQHFHATPLNIAPEEQLKVPLLVWGSEPLLTDPIYQKFFDTLQKKQGSVRTHRQLFDSIMGCIGYQSPDGGINQKNNWCSDTEK